MFGDVDVTITGVSRVLGHHTGQYAVTSASG